MNANGSSFNGTMIISILLFFLTIFPGLKLQNIVRFLRTHSTKSMMVTGVVASSKSADAKQKSSASQELAIGVASAVMADGISHNLRSLNGSLAKGQTLDHKVPSHLKAYEEDCHKRGGVVPSSWEHSPDVYGDKLIFYTDLYARQSFGEAAGILCLKN